MLAERAATWKDLYLQEGLMQGRTEGLAQGRVKALAESVRAMTKALGISEDRALEILNVSEEERKAIVPLLRQ